MGSAMVRWRICLLMLVLLVQTRFGMNMAGKHAKLEKQNDKIDADDADDNDDHGDNDDNEDDLDEDDDEEDEGGGGRGKLERTSLTLRRTSTSYEFSSGASTHTPQPRTVAPVVSRTTKKKPLECYTCIYKRGVELKACLDPWKHSYSYAVSKQSKCQLWRRNGKKLHLDLFQYISRVHTVVCPSLTDRCLTWIVSKDGNYEAVTRGCKSACVTSPEIICCEFNRCNNQALSLPYPAPQIQVSATSSHSKKSKNLAKKPTPPTVLFFVTILLLLQTVVKVPLPIA